MISFRRLQTSLTVAVAIVASVVFLSSCSHQRTVQVGTHTVTISRHGFEKKIDFNAKATIPTFQYKGMKLPAGHLSVVIRGDDVKVDDVYLGRLRPGDSVRIGDRGLTVNSMDYGESEKYLRANGSVAESTAQN